MSLRGKKRKKILTIKTGETATKERRQQGQLVTEIVDRGATGEALIKRQRALVTCPLEYYFNKGILAESEFKAGMKFKIAYMRAVLNLKLDISVSSGDPEMAFIIVPYSKKLLNQAYEAISPAQKTRVIQACGHDEYLGDRDRIQTLKRGLNKLATIWQFI